MSIVKHTNYQVPCSWYWYANKHSQLIERASIQLMHAIICFGEASISYARPPCSSSPTVEYTAIDYTAVPVGGTCKGRSATASAAGADRPGPTPRPPVCRRYPIQSAFVHLGLRLTSRFRPLSLFLLIWRDYRTSCRYARPVVSFRALWTQT